MKADLTSGLRRALRSVQPPRDAHPGLWLDRFLSYQTWPRDEEPTDYDKDKAQAARDDLVQQASSRSLAEGYRLALRDWERDLEVLGDRAVVEIGRSLGRVVVGLGAKGAAELGISLHRTWGVPVLPGSSLKGIAALGADRYLEAAQWRRRPRASEARLEPTAYDALFGDPEEQGAVIFHDAWLVPSGTHCGLHQDVLTVHHPGYYRGEAAEPSDTDSPIPVPFISASGSFRIALSLHEGLDPDRHGGWLEAAWTALREGLLRHGIGAKTSAGYGRVELPQWSETKRAKGRAQRAALEALSPGERAEQILRQPQGARQLREWLRSQGASEQPGLSPDEAHVRVVTRLLKEAGESKGIVKNAPEAWEPWILAELALLKGGPVKESPPPAKERVSLDDAQIQAIIKGFTKKGRFASNRAAKRFAGKQLDAASLDRAIAALEDAGARPSHLKKLRAQRAAIG